MLIRQIEVELKNTVGELEKIVQILAMAEIDIKALTLTDCCEKHSRARMIVHDPDEAQKLLRDTGYSVDAAEVIIIELPDRPGGLEAVLKIIRDAMINIQHIYAFMSRIENKALAVCNFDDNSKAIEVLKNNGITLVTSQSIVTESGDSSFYEEHRLGDYVGGMFPW